MDESGHRGPVGPVNEHCPDLLLFRELRCIHHRVPNVLVVLKGFLKTRDEFPNKYIWTVIVVPHSRLKRY